MEKLDFNENQSVFRVGESSDKMFLLVKGKVGIFLPKNETKDADFFVEENELFGEVRWVLLTMNFDRPLQGVLLKVLLLLLQKKNLMNKLIHQIYLLRLVWQHCLID